MIKYLVIWTVINSWMVPCDHGPMSGIDEYGRRWESYVTTLEVCYDSEQHQEQREFDSYEEALAFKEKGEKSCEDDIFGCSLSNWIIKEVGTKWTNTNGHSPGQR
jgi:hypothetical protein